MSGTQYIPYDVESCNLYALQYTRGPQNGGTNKNKNHNVSTGYLRKHESLSYFLTSIVWNKHASNVAFLFPLMWQRTRFVFFYISVLQLIMILRFFVMICSFIIRFTRMTSCDKMQKQINQLIGDNSYTTILPVHLKCQRPTRISYLSVFVIHFI